MTLSRQAKRSPSATSSSPETAKFALGFFPPRAGNISKYTGHNNTSTTSPDWYLGIWFNMIPVFTPVWVANRETPISDPKRNLTQLQISTDGNLVIFNHATESTVWSTRIANKTQTTTSTTNTTAVLLDSGSLALMESLLPLWQSFDYPADVFLPGAKFRRNKVTGLNRQFISNKNLIDPGLGSYSIGMDTNGAMLLRSRSPYVVYWSSGSSIVVSLLKELLDMNPQTKGLISPAYVDNSEEQYCTYTVVDESSLVIGLLDITGQVKMNVWSQLAIHSLGKRCMPSLLLPALLMLPVGLLRCVTAI
jgi:hypothetical protein